MRFLGIGDTCDLGALYMRLLSEGHQVRVAVGEPLAKDTMAGLIDFTQDWERELEWVRAAADDGIILFENVAKSRGSLQDKLRADGFNVVGGSSYGDRLENDRAYAQRVLTDIGLQTCKTIEFDSATDADDFLDRHPGKYVLKFNGPGYSSSDNYVGRLSTGVDVRAVLRAKALQLGEKSISFVLMECVAGVEMGVGGYFNGDDFVGRACLDWEHKRFFPDDLGELTGEMGTIATFDRSETFFNLTLRRMTPLLRANGYCGYINLNTIVNENGIFPLEFTCRFGYPGFAVLSPLQQTRWADLFKAMTSKSGKAVMLNGFCAGIVITTPPFPYDRKTVAEPAGLPVLLDDLNPSELNQLYFGEVGLLNGQLVTTGQYGWTMVVTGVGDTIQKARAEANRIAKKLIVPNARYRLDIGARLVSGDFALVEKLGLLDGLA